MALFDLASPVVWNALYLHGHPITSQTHTRRTTTRILQSSPKSVEVGPGQGRAGQGEGNGESVSIAGHHTTAERDDTSWPGVGGRPLTSEARLSQGPMLQVRHQTKQLCLVDVAHSIHLILGSSNKPIEVAPANPPNSLSLSPPLPTHRSKLDLPTPGLPAHLLPV